MKNLVFNTNHGWMGFVARLTVGIVLFPHGAQKMLGIFGGNGFAGTIDFFTGQMGLPWIIAFLIIVIEFVGSLSMIAGFASRIWAIAMIVLFIGIIFAGGHLQNGFFMDWGNNGGGEGFEYHLLMLGLLITVLINGSGKFSVDGAISTRKNTTEIE